jgi:hypothetical protein
VLTSCNIIFETPSGDYTSQPAVPTDPIRLEGEMESVDEPASSQPQPEIPVSHAPTPIIPDPPSAVIEADKPSAAAPKAKRNILQMPPREPREPRQATQGTKVYDADTYYRTLRNPSNQSPAKPDAWRHRVPDSDVANVAVDVEPSTYRQATAHPHADD